MQRTQDINNGLLLIRARKLEREHKYEQAYHHYLTFYQANFKKAHAKFRMLVCQIKGHALPLSEQTMQRLLDFSESLSNEANDDALLAELVNDSLDDKFVADSNYYYAHRIYKAIDLQSLAKEKAFLNIKNIDEKTILTLISRAQKALRLAQEKYKNIMNQEFDLASTRNLIRDFSHLATQYNQSSSQLSLSQAKEDEENSSQQTFKQLRRAPAKTSSTSLENVAPLKEPSVGEKRKPKTTTMAQQFLPIKKRRQVIIPPTPLPTIPTPPVQSTSESSAQEEERPKQIFYSSLRIATHTFSGDTSSSLAQHSLHAASSSRVAKNIFLGRFLAHIAVISLDQPYQAIKLKAAIFDLFNAATLLNPTSKNIQNAYQDYLKQIMRYESSPFFHDDFSELDLHGRPLRLFVNREKFHTKTADVFFNETLTHFIKVLKETSPHQYQEHINILLQRLAEIDPSKQYSHQLSLILRQIAKEESKEISQGIEERPSYRHI